MITMYENELVVMMHSLAGSALPKSEPTVELIIAATCKALQVNAEDLKSKCRKRELSEARFITMMLIENNCGLNAAQIGPLFNRDRTTALNALRTAEDLQDNRGFYTKTIAVKNQLAEDLK